MGRIVPKFCDLFFLGEFGVLHPVFSSLCVWGYVGIQRLTRDRIAWTHYACIESIEIILLLLFNSL